MNTNDHLNAAMQNFTTEEYAEVLEKVIKGIRRSCLNCGNFVDKTEQCSIYKARPPAKIIANGCDKFNYMPF